MRSSLETPDQSHKGGRHYAANPSGCKASVAHYCTCPGVYYVKLKDGSLSCRGGCGGWSKQCHMNPRQDSTTTNSEWRDYAKWGYFELEHHPSAQRAAVRQ